jgi:hypothetical protein
MRALGRISKTPRSGGFRHATGGRVGHRSGKSGLAVKLVGLAALSFLVLVTATCGTKSQPAASETSHSVVTSSAPSSAVVDGNGATVSRVVGGVRVTAIAPAGVADSGTALTISDGATSVKPFQVEVASSSPVKLVLGSGTQPKKPIALQFDLSGQPELAAKFSDSVKPVIGSVSDDDPSVTDLLPGTWDLSSKTVTATTDHLSIFQLIAAGIGQVVNAVTTAWKNAAGTAESPCTDKSELTIGSTKLTLTPSKSGPVAGCLRDAGGGVEIDFTNGTSQYYAVTSSSAGNFTNPAPLKSDDQIAVWLHANSANHSGLLTPKGTGQLRLSAGTTNASIHLDIDPIALQLKTILTGLDMLGVDEDQLAKAFQDSKSALDCLTTAVSTVTEPAKNVGELRTALGDVAQCGLAGAQAGYGNADKNQVLHRMSVAISLVTTLPDQLLANITGAIGEFTGDNHLEFMLTSEGPSSQAPPPSTATLVPLVIKTHGSPGDSGQELGPNHFQLGHKLKDNGRFYVSLALRWKTSDGTGVADYCTEHSKVIDSSGNVVLQRDQPLAVCDNGGGWSFNLSNPGTYTYVLDIERRSGGNVHGEQQFTVDP